MLRITSLCALPLLLTILVAQAAAAVVSYDWTITWVSANPDGRLTRPVIGVNNVWPPPTINVNKGDRLIVKVTNGLGNETTTIHWHGLFQTGSNTMDGPAMVNQCPIPPGMSYTYDFTINQPGSYWYHSHDNGQYPDGLRGALIVHDPQAPYANQFDEELVLTFSDWYHGQMPDLIPFYLSQSQNTDGSEPVPYSALLNDVPSGQAKLAVAPGKTYLLHIVSMATFAQSYIWIDDHDMTVVEVDGVYTVPKKANSLYLATAQRYSVLIKTKSNKAGVAFPINAYMDSDKFDSVPDYTILNTTAYLVYNSHDQQKSHGSVTYLPSASVNVSTLAPPGDMDFVPYDHMPLLGGKPDRTITLNLNFSNEFNMNLAYFNNITYIAPKVPTLYTILNAPQHEAWKLDNASVYGIHTNPWVLCYGELVEVVINNYDEGAHIMHLHGHNFQLLAKSADIPAFGGDGVGTPYNPAVDGKNFPQYPMRRDTWVVPANGYSVMRFRATNPGVWLLHCHMEWHVIAGLSATLISSPEIVRATQRMDPNMAKICAARGIPTVGNAAGNTQDYYNLNGQPLQPPANQHG